MKGRRRLRQVPRRIGAKTEEEEEEEEEERERKGGTRASRRLLLGLRLRAAASPWALACALSPP